MNGGQTEGEHGRVSAIVGVLDRTATGVDSDRIRALTTQLQQFGPDGACYWVGDSVGVGYQHHRTTPEAPADPPPVQEGSTVVVADLRLDNRSELRTRLDCRDEGISDTALLREAYEEWGVYCPDELVGAFAFAIWDCDRHRLLCARDHIGVKPLYVVDQPETVAVASAVPPLLDVPGVDVTPNHTRIGDFLTGRFENREATFYENVERLPPGHSITVTRDEVQRRAYWSPADVEPLDTAPQAAYERRFRELFETAVADRMRAAGRVGSLLSGGLDSSSICCVAGRRQSETGAEPLPTVSAVFDSVPACDEREYIQAVLDAGRFDPTFVRGDQIGPLDAVDTMLEGGSEPYYPSLFMLIPGLFAEANDAGIDVLLNGYGGDQTMGSDLRGHLRGLARRGRVLSLLSEVRAYANRYPGLSTRGVLWRDVLRPLAPGPIRRTWHRRFDPEHYVANAFAPLNQGFAHESGLAGRLARDATSAPARSQRALRRRSLAASEPSFYLERSHVAGALTGVEPRFPYFDKRLVEFSLGLPPGQTVQNGLDRTIVRAALGDELPDAVRRRDDKAEFSPNVVHGFTTYGIDDVDDALFDAPPDVGRYLDTAALEAARERIGSDPDVSDARTLCMATMLERWLDHTSERGSTENR